MTSPTAVVFAYHNVGVRCLATLLAHGVEVPLVVTHEDRAGEAIWFDSVAQLAARNRIPVIAPADVNTPDVLKQITDLHPDYLFSFYFRQMLKPALLAATARGAFNMHGSLLPKYRGRVPVNWAVIKGEASTGATLHTMVEKPDAGLIAGQMAVPILPDDTAHDVFGKVTVAAELVLDRALPALLAGTLQCAPQDFTKASYFGGRKPEDGKINWYQDAQAIHNLVRGVAPPYPGAFAQLAGKPLRVLRTAMEKARAPHSPGAGLYVDNGELFADCGNATVLRVLWCELDGAVFDALKFRSQFGERKQPLM
jgi:methionyl-tRNA formyltransferase